MKYLKKFESKNGFDKIQKIIECLRHIEPDKKYEFYYGKDYSYNINFDYNGVHYYSIRLYGHDLETYVIYGDDKLDDRNDGHLLTKCGVELIDALYEYFLENYSEYINAIDMGLL